MNEPDDFSRLLAEIDDEVDRRRASGEIPADVERELQEVFEQHVPKVAAADDLGGAVERVREAGEIDIAASVASARPGVPQVKGAIRAATAFQTRHLAGQVERLASAVVNSLELVADRLEALGSDRTEIESVRASLGDRVVDWVPEAPTIAALVGRSQPQGLVLHLDAGDGSFVAAALDAGLDVIGVVEHHDRRRALPDDVRAGDPLTYLRAVADNALGGVVVSLHSCSINDALRVARDAVRVVGPDGVVVIVVLTAEAWTQRVGAAGADLAPGAPPALDTWKHALAHYGAVGVTASPVDPNGVAIVVGYGASAG